MRILAVLVLSLCFGVGCNRSKGSPSAGGTSEPATPGAAVVGKAEVGKAAPDFELKDLDGKSVKLSSFRGKTVVLEWFNPDCPYVRMSHTKGSLKASANSWNAKDSVVWLAINSGAPGKQGHGAETNKAGVARFGLQYPVLADESGAAGKAYGATNTPHLYVIDKQGVLVYAGAIDNSPDGEGQSPTDGTLINYAVAAVEAVEAGREVTVKQTEAYGCSVKY